MGGSGRIGGPWQQDGRGMLLAEPPHGPSGATMARRRGQQKGYVHKQGNAWYLAYREDALDAEGKIVRVRRNQRIADAKEASKREAQRIAREIWPVWMNRCNAPHRW